MKNSNWFPVKRQDLFVVLFILVYVIVFFLPWSYDVMFYNISLNAWASLALFIIAPLLSIVIISNAAKGS